jgi:hypothetical protein
MAEIKQKQFLKLSQTKQFTIESFKGKKYKKWDAENKRMLESPTWQDGYRLMYRFEATEGILELSKSQVGEMCASVLDQYGRANLSGVTFLVKTNGKTGMDIRYFFNPVKKEDHVEEEIDVDSLNF